MHVSQGPGVPNLVELRWKLKTHGYRGSWSLHIQVWVMFNCPVGLLKAKEAGAGLDVDVPLTVHSYTCVP